MKITIKPVKKISGEITVPPDKSISHRALMIGALANGITRIKGILDCDDCNHTITALKKMGIDIKKKSGITVIKGKGLKGLRKPSGPINVGNSGTTIRLLCGILAGQDFEAALTGDKGLRARPMKRIVEPLSRMGVNIRARQDNYPPIMIKGGRVKPINYKTPIPSAQIKSAILFAGLYAKGVTKVTERFKSRDHTERMLKFFGSKLTVDGLKVSVEGRGKLKARNIKIPGDISSAAFFIAAAVMLKGSRIKIKDVSINPTRTGILNILSRMGAKVKVTNKKKGFEPVGDIAAAYSKTRGIIIDKSAIPSVIDELPVIFVLASVSKGRTIIKGAGELKVKETDRIRSMRENLKAMGAKIYVKKDNIIIEGVESLKAARVRSFGDHRTCMAMAIAALKAKGESTIEGVESISKSFPEFFTVLGKLKAFDNDIIFCYYH